MKKPLAFALSLIVCIAILSGCKQEIPEESERFMLLDQNMIFSVYVDLETGVEYLSKGHCITMLVDSYGNPYLYPAFDAREDATSQQKEAYQEEQNSQPEQHSFYNDFYIEQEVSDVQIP